MKEIKFKIHDKELKESYILKLEELAEDDYWYDGETSMYEVLSDCNNEQERFVLLRYTGFKDKDGDPIYEGDIVQIHTIIADIKEGIWQESFCDEYDCSHYGWYINHKYSSYCSNTGMGLWENAEHCEVIGNIYDTPELLKGGEKNED